MVDDPGLKATSGDACWLLGIAASLALAMCPIAPAMASDIKTSPFGTWTDGRPVERISLENDRHMKLSVIDYGATITSIEVPDRHGRFQNVVLSLPSLADYRASNRRWAGVIGRYAGRIGSAQFPLNGQIIKLVPGASGYTIHSDPDGYDHRLWQHQTFSKAHSIGVTFTLDSPNGDQNFPGHVQLRVTYRLFKGRNEFRIEYSATSDQPTVTNLTNHAYLNLAGVGNPGLAGHRFQILADRFALTDSKKVPTGELASVTGTPLDFRKPVNITPYLTPESMIFGSPTGFDHSLIFSEQNAALKRVAIITERQSGRRLDIATTEPSVQFNSGNGFDGSDTGTEGVAYARYAGFAFETQHLPDSPNHPNFPSTVLIPGQILNSVTSYKFSLVR